MEKPLKHKGITFWLKMNTSYFNELWVGALEMPLKSEGIATHLLFFGSFFGSFLCLEMPLKSEGIATFNVSSDYYVNNWLEMPLKSEGIATYPSVLYDIKQAKLEMPWKSEGIATRM